MKGNSRINECCFVMLIISWLSVLPHKHPHELLDSVVKEQLVKSFVSTEAAHSTAASLSVKLFFDFVSAETSFYSTTCAFDQNFFSPAGGAFYSAQNRCQHLFFTAFDPFDRTTNRIKPAPCRPTRILHARSSFASPSFNLTYWLTSSFWSASSLKWRAFYISTASCKPLTCK